MSLSKNEGVLPVREGSDEASNVFVLPATPNQTRFWSLDQLRPGNAALNMPLAWSCRGELNPDLVAETLAELVVRHESLRTTFDLVEGKLSQIIQPPYRVPVPLDDLSHLEPEVRKERADALIRKESRIRMDMKRGPLFFARLLRLASREHILLITMHHSICDGWSNGIVLRDFAAIYDGLVRRQQPDLPQLDIQYGDFAVWLEDWRTGKEHEESLAYWRETLGRDFSPIQLNHDPPTATTEIQADIETLLLPERLVQQARDFCASEGVTLYMLLLAVFATEIFRLTGQPDILIGSPAANRKPETENLIGSFANPQVIRIRLEPRASFRKVLDAVRAWTLGAISHQVLPFEDLVDDPFFSGERNHIHPRLYFLYQKAFMQAQRAAGLDIAPIPSVSPGTTFELMLSIVERAEGPRLQLEYNPESFQIPTIQRILRMYARILEAGIQNPARPVEELEILDEAERHLVLEKWNRTSRELGAFAPVHRLFERMAAQTPNRVAVVCGGESWTYRQLNEYGNRVARHLRGQGVSEGSLVAICVSRSREMLGVVLGVLKAGAAYLPLDPAYPSDRINAILADAEATLLFTEEKLAERLRVNSPTVYLDKEQGSWSQLSGNDLEVESGPGSLAYVIYTSGSTGKPKGVAIEHGALTNLLRSMEREPGLKASDVLVSVTTLSFDIAALELFLPLIAGARLAIATQDTVRDGYKLLALLRETNATVLQSTPGAWRMLIEAGWHGQPKLKVLCGGEAMPRDLADTLRMYSDDVWNLYGPTETTIWSSATRVGPGAVRIGPPIANTQFYVLDARLQPVPVGVTGELFIGGAGLAREYWRRPELTEEKFLPNPFAPGRIYRTGDLARWRADGYVDLLGRTDHQVKVRGYRIELLEIETVLTGHPAVRDAVVAAVDNGSGEKMLGAWVDLQVASPPGDLVEQLQALLTRKLPEYMVPSSISVLPALPRTANGKIDRKNLPQPQFLNPSERQIVEPKNDAERRLLTIWQSVLGVEGISVSANFFELGGTSLMILRLIAKVNTEFQSLLPIPIIYTAPTIEKMARVLFKEEKDFVLALQPNGQQPPLFMIQSYHLYRTLPAALGADQPFYGVRELELQDREFPYTLDSLVKAYVAHIREVQPQGPYYLSGFCFFALLAFAVAGELERQGEEVAFLGLIDANCPYYWRSQSTDAGRWQRYKTVLLHTGSEISKLDPMSRVTHLTRFAAKKAWNQLLGFSLWVRTGVYSYFMERKMRLPWPLRNKAMVTRVAARMHRPGPIRADIFLFPAMDQPYPVGFDTALGWTEMTSGHVKTIWLRGNHEDMFLESNIDVMAQKLRQSMNEVMVSYAASQGKSVP